MTNKEAIRLIRNLPTMCVFTNAYGEPVDSSAYYDAIEIALFALRAQDSQKKFDTISRQALCEYALNQKDKSVTPNDIMRFPSVQPESRWIPVSERLPNLDKYSHGENWKRKVLITGYLSFDDKKELFVSEEFANDVINDSVHDTIVIAWMPSPEPFKEIAE